MFVYKLGDGKMFSFWFDPWCHGYSLAEIFPSINVRRSQISQKANVCEYWRNGSWYLPFSWNSDMDRVLDFLNSNFVVEANTPDCISWGPGKEMEFSIRSAFNCLFKPGQKLKWTNLVWSKSNLPRHSFTLWLALHKRLPTKDKLCE